MKEFLDYVISPIAIIIIGLILAITVCGTSLSYALREEKRLSQPHEAFIVKVQTDAQIKMNEQRCKTVEYCFDAVASIFGK